MGLVIGHGRARRAATRQRLLGLGDPCNPLDDDFDAVECFQGSQSPPPEPPPEPGQMTPGNPNGTPFDPGSLPPFVKQKVDECAAKGLGYDAASGQCFGGVDADCPPGQKFDLKTYQCSSNPEIPIADCPPGQIKSPVNGKCYLPCGGANTELDWNADGQGNPGCGCKKGFVWVDPNDPNNYDCKPAPSGGGGGGGSPPPAPPKPQPPAPPVEVVQKTEKKSNTLLYLAGGAIVVAAGVGAFFLAKPKRGRKAA